MYKTQVLVTQTNDHHRTRLTHTLEVAQISRTIARQLGLNEDLTEAIALAHDLGHPPFGHAGETALDECMADHGGFEHNRHGLRIVERPRIPLRRLPGPEPVLGSARSPGDAQQDAATRRMWPRLPRRRPAAARSPGRRCRRQPGLRHPRHRRRPERRPHHARTTWTRCRSGGGRSSAFDSGIANLTPVQFQPAVVRALIDWQVTDLLEHTRQNLRRTQASAPSTTSPLPRPCWSGPAPEVVRLKAELEEFLHERVYRHHRVMRMADKGERMLRQLFEEFCAHARQLLPDRYARTARAVLAASERSCDYLAGMTDRYAQDEYLDCSSRTRRYIE